MLETFVSDFVLERKRDRFLALASTPSLRDELVGQLVEEGTWIDPRFRVELQKHQRQLRAIVILLRSYGCGEKLYVISPDTSLDDRSLALVDGIAMALDRDDPIALYCSIGHAAFIRDH